MAMTNPLLYHPQPYPMQQHNSYPQVAYGQYQQPTPFAMLPHHRQNVPAGTVATNLSHPPRFGNRDSPGSSTIQDQSLHGASPPPGHGETRGEPYYAPYVTTGPEVGQTFYSPSPNVYAQGIYQPQTYSPPFYSVHQYAYPVYGQQPQMYYASRPSHWAGQQPGPWAPSSVPSLSAAPVATRVSPNGGSLPKNAPQNIARSSSTPNRTSPRAAMTDKLSETIVKEPKGNAANEQTQQALMSQQRSEFVLWCGNVPADATLAELWEFFTAHNKNIVGEGADVVSHGVISIFIISRSNCAFVNYTTAEHLKRAVFAFNGKQVRPSDPRCPKLVCRVRRKDDEVSAGVGGQRGRGMHVAWIKEQEKLSRGQQHRGQDKDGESDIKAGFVPSSGMPSESESGEQTTMSPNTTSASPVLTRTASQDNIKPEATSLQPDSMTGAQSIDASSTSASGSISHASTNSSLFRHPLFYERYFILKSRQVEDLDDAVRTQSWVTQPHNEPVLDQAFRNSEKVYLIFSANQSGGFYGYARMTSAIHQTVDKSQQGGLRPEAIPEGDERMISSSIPRSEDGQTMLAPNFSVSPMATEPMESPLQITPSELGENESPLANALPKVTTASEASSFEQRVSLSSDIPAHVTSPNAPIIVTNDSQDAKDNNQADERPPSTSIVIQPEKTEGKQEETGPEMSIFDTTLASTNSEPYKDSQKKSRQASTAAATYPPVEARNLNQLAIRALIHNLRLEEREASRRAGELEGQMEGMKHGVSSDPHPADSSLGKQFKIEWIKTYPLSFQIVRKLRNPWRDNRQIKVSRDGTELEPNVGRQLRKIWDEAESCGLTAENADQIVNQALRAEGADAEI